MQVNSVCKEYFQKYVYVLVLPTHTFDLVSLPKSIAVNLIMVFFKKVLNNFLVETYMLMIQSVFKLCQILFWVNH